MTTVKVKCDYCNENEAVTQTDMMDFVCQPCLIGKPKTVQPKLGMSVSMGIGSDSYHQIIVKMERNSKTIYAMSARRVLGGVALEDWNALPESIKAKRAADALQQHLDIFEADEIEYGYKMSEGWAMGQTTKCYTFRSTGKNAGQYARKGTNYCWITLNDQYEYSDPSF
jgi:hypothetical protein